MKEKKRKFHNGRYAMLPPELLGSDLYLRDLSKKETVVLIRFYQKIKWKQRKGRAAKLRMGDVTNNSRIIFTYAEAEALGVSRSTFARILSKLIEVGFIDIAEDGNPYSKTPTRFSISERWKKRGQPDFVEVTKRRMLPKEYGFQPGNQEHLKQK